MRSCRFGRVFRAPSNCAGSQAHKDSTGAQGVIGETKIQTMSAGSGTRNSEYNASATAPFHGYQIWVYPKECDVAPRHDTFSFRPEQKANKIGCLAGQ